MTEDLRPATVAVTAGRPPHEPDQPLNQPLVMASTYVAGGDLEYGRYGNPTWTAFEDTLGALEGGRAAVATAPHFQLLPRRRLPAPANLHLLPFPGRALTSLPREGPDLPKTCRWTSEHHCYSGTALPSLWRSLSGSL